VVFLHLLFLSITFVWEILDTLNLDYR
jgi:hypothetical protein